MTLAQIQEFVLVCRHGSIAAAARTLGKSRGAVSMGIAALEDHLGVTLFERSGNQVKPTPIGADLLDDCQRIVSLAQSLEQRCRRHFQGEERILRIARDDALPEAFWREIVIRLSRRFPNLDLCFGLSTMAELDAMIASGEVDLGIGLRRVSSRPSASEAVVLSPVQVMMVAAAGHPLTLLQQVSEQDLRDYPFIGQAHFTAQGLRVTDGQTARQVGVSHFELMRDMAAEGIGWTWLPQPLAADYLETGRLVIPKHATAVRMDEYVALKSRHYREGQVTDWLLGQVREYLRRSESGG
ncbi:LysR family transcriptional regulator [Ectothiorhodospira lacustris]|uniref:LysR family transcriptional regulator n=1 Tax=Ectothiorhodospira lacustris TaxID=2899127 RepID=UPI001EE96BDC|nr:LysR family transcriptional regulator [Ectothiorhodospira lacustris]MCG5509779.1 LysR family transcriptional regulator [Ectothiorhodospira lacustris]MCG5522307.1 LysR family transcriptional regulator [Ectothiorhodospira lacustris]